MGVFGSKAGLDKIESNITVPQSIFNKFSYLSMIVIVFKMPHFDEAIVKLSPTIRTAWVFVQHVNILQNKPRNLFKHKSQLKSNMCLRKLIDEFKNTLPRSWSK